jgi:hypothetical protein
MPKIQLRNIRTKEILEEHTGAEKKLNELHKRAEAINRREYGSRMVIAARIKPKDDGVLV